MSNWNFAESVRTVLLFLGKYGFEEISSEPTIVRFASPRTFLNVYVGRSSQELAIEIGRVGDDCERGYSMSELIRAKEPKRAGAYRNSTVSSPSELGAALDALSRDLKVYGEDVLQGDAETFALLARNRKESANSFAADVKYRQTIPLADDAFRKRDYPAAVRYYESIRDRLGPAELKKLEFAKKHCL